MSMNKHVSFVILALVSLFLLACSGKEKEIVVQSIAISQPSAELEVDETLTLKATVSPSNASYDGMTWTSTQPRVASVSDSGFVTALSEGSTTITVMAGGKTASCSITVSSKMVSVSAVSLDKTSLSMTVGDAQSLVATVSPQNATDKSVAWSSSNTTVATVSSSGLVSAKAIGSTIITVTTNDGGKKATCSITVQKNKIAVESITLNKTELSLVEGTSETLSATVKPDDATDKTITWKSANASIAIVENGVVTALAVGETTISASAGEKTASCKVSVKQKITPSLSISPSQSSVSKDGGEIEVKVTSNTDYSISIPAEYKDWISLKSENNSNHTHVFKVSPNAKPDLRNGRIDFSINDYTKSHQISQEGNPSLETQDYSFSFEPEGGNGTIHYKGNFQCETSVSANWITITSHSYKNNDGVIVFSVAKNNGENSRIDYIKLTGYGLSTLVTIKQNEVLSIVNITTTKAGTLSNYLGSSQIYQVKAYKISGPLNSVDFDLIRRMAGNKGDKLKYLDLSDATIVSGGGKYWYKKYYYNGYRYEENEKYTTKDNTITSYMLTDCWRLETIILPKTVTTIEKDAFYDFGITSITLPDNIQRIESSFDSYNCKEILLNKNNRYYAVVDGILYSKDMKTLLSCPAKNEKAVGKYEVPSSVEEIYPMAFYSCKKITDLVIPQSVLTIGEYAFAWCTLESITIYPMTKYGFLGYDTKFHNVIIPNGYSEFDAVIFVPGNFDVRGNVKIDDLWVYCKTPPLIDTWHQFNSDNKKNTILHVPTGSLSAYKLAFCWGEFKNIQEFNPY